MKILMLTPYLPYPPASGGQIRTLNLLKHLSKNHKITLISLYKNAKEKEYTSHLKEYCHEVHLCKRAERPWQFGIMAKAMFSFLPFLITRNYSSEAHELITQLLKKEKFDVIHAETFYIMPHIPPTNIPILLVEQTIEFKVYQHYISSLPLLIRAALSLDILKLKFWETYCWKRARVVAAVSDADKQIIQSIAPQINPVIIPNGAGDEMFLENKKTANSKRYLLFIGNFYWLQNTEAALYLSESLFPEIQKKISDVHLVIAGQNSKNKIRSSNKNIEVIDIKQDDVDTVKRLYQEATLFVAPIFGPGGTRLKILAAMAAKLPIISTSVGVEGLELQDGKHVLIANTQQEFIDRILQLLTDERLFESIETNAYKVAKDKYSWDAIANKLAVVYKSVINEP
ncbi:glycosyltransferase [Candidatus Roizmanbacteria bacterium]|nr:glycosyltransferase [Candidatus Roizmanbacteria bacterium]